jgi:hypothetical protein
MLGRPVDLRRITYSHWLILAILLLGVSEIFGAFMLAMATEKVLQFFELFRVPSAFTIISASACSGRSDGEGGGEGPC